MGSLAQKVCSDKKIKTSTEVAAVFSMVARFVRRQRNVQIFQSEVLQSFLLLGLHGLKTLMSKIHYLCLPGCAPTKRGSYN